jgi:hypothetical protein
LVGFYFVKSVLAHKEAKVTRRVSGVGGDFETRRKFLLVEQKKEGKNLKKC